MKILIIEDEKNIRSELRQLLENAFYEAVVIEDFNHVVKQILHIQPDLILLDLNLPDKDGQAICKELRETSQIPVIFLTGEDNVMTELDCIVLGGDDYITKPYLPSLLLVRIQAVLKRTYHSQHGDSGALLHKGVTLHTESYKLSYEGNEVELTKTECRLMHYLFQRKGEVIARADIIEYLWDLDVFIDDNVLSVNITRLRSKLEALGVSHFIQTKRGAGYQI